MTQTERTYPDPEINAESERYWAAAKEGVLLVKKCNACGLAHYYPRSICPHCFSGDTQWHAASGRGRIHTFSVMRRSAVPYVIAYVDLDEGVAMMTNIVDCDLDRIAIGQEVEVTFRTTQGGHALPVFRPRAADRAGS